MVGEWATGIGIIVTSCNFCSSSLAFHNALSCGYFFPYMYITKPVTMKSRYLWTGCMIYSVILGMRHTVETKLKTIQDTIFLHSKTDTVASEGSRTFQLNSGSLLHLCCNVIWRLARTGYQGATY